jgi:hypothetical protein
MWIGRGACAGANGNVFRRTLVEQCYVFSQHFDLIKKILQHEQRGALLDS